MAALLNRLTARAASSLRSVLLTQPSLRPSSALLAQQQDIRCLHATPNFSGPSSSSTLKSEQADSAEAAKIIEPKVVVFGGNGYVGSEVCKALLDLGLSVISVNRSGPPATVKDWTKDVAWIRGDALEPEAWKDELKNACGVISCVGAFGSQDFMERVCGDTMVQIAKTAAEAGVSRCVFISAHDYKLPEVSMNPLNGYVKGKKKGEAAVLQYFPSSGVSLRPGFIHGTRAVGPISIPLGLIGSPLETLTRNTTTLSLTSTIPQLGLLLCPPTSVQDVAAAAARAATDDSVPKGVITAWDIPKYKL